MWISYYHLARGLRCLSLSAAWVRIEWAITIVIQAPQRFSIACVGIDHHDNQTSDPADIRKPQITDPTIEFTLQLGKGTGSGQLSGEQRFAHMLKCVCALMMMVGERLVIRSGVGSG